MTFKSDQRSVSEVTGYMLSFSIIILLSLGVMAAGMPIITHYSAIESEKAAETSFNNLHDKVQHVDANLINSNEDVAIPAGDLYQQPNPTTITFDHIDAGEEITIETHPIVYEASGSDVEVLYNNIFISTMEMETGNLRNLQPLANHQGESNPTLDIPALSPMDGTPATSSGRGFTAFFTISTLEAHDTATFDEADGDTVELTVSTRHDTAWVEYLQGQLYIDQDTLDQDGDEITAEIDLETVETVTITTNKIGITFAR